MPKNIKSEIDTKLTHLTNHHQMKLNELFELIESIQNEILYKVEN